MCKRTRVFSCIMATVLLAGCQTKTVDLENNLIEQDSLLNKEKFIAQSAERNIREAHFGPRVDTSKDHSIRRDARKHISTEQPPKFDEIETSKYQNNFEIDLNVENVDIRTFADMLADITGMNFMVSDEVNTLVTAKVEGVKWPSVLDSILSMKGLAKHVDHKSNIIRIHDQATVMAIEDFNRKRKENMQKAMQLKQASEPVFTEVFKLYYTNPEEVKEMLSGIIDIKKGAGGESGSGLRDTRPEITVDMRKNLMIVKARKDDMKVISRLVEEVDSRTQQVFIEAFIVEVTDGFERALGARFGVQSADTTAQGNTFATGGVAGAGGTGLQIGDSTGSAVELALPSAFGGIGFLAGIGNSTDLKLELTALEEEGLSKVISNPKVFTLDNQEAVIFQGDEVPYETVSEEGTNIEFKEAGLKLAVRPTVVGDGNLVMDITVNKDTVDTSQPNPPIRKSEIKTSLVSRNGSIVIIGGIYDENKTQSSDKVPGLGDVPGAGRLFRRDNAEDNRRELMVFIAPRII